MSTDQELEMDEAAAEGLATLFYEYGVPADKAERIATQLLKEETEEW